MQCVKILTKIETPGGPVHRGDVTPHVREALPGLGGASLRIARHLLDDPASVTVSPIGELAALTGTSPASITRFCQAIGVSSYPELRIRLAGELGRTGADALRDDGAGLPVWEVVARTAARVAQQAAEAIDGAVLRAAADRVAAAGRILIFGVGGSATVAQEAHLRLLRLGLAAWAPAGLHDAMMAAALMRPGDALVAVSRSGRTAEVLAVAAEARAGGAEVIALTSFGRSPLAGTATLLLVLPAEDLDASHGAAAVKYGQMVALDALVALVARRLGPAASEALARTAQALAPYRALARPGPRGAGTD